MKKIILLVLISMMFSTINGQELNGKWILKDLNTGTKDKFHSGFQLLEIKDSIAKLHTDFSLQKEALDFKILENELLNAKNKKFAEYKIIDTHHLKLFIKGKQNEKEAVFEGDFYRLEPTITKIKKEEIEKITFILTQNERKEELVFNKELWNKERLKLFKTKEGEKRMIEQIDSTFFISFYYNGKRDVSLPIKEVTTEFLKLYAIPTGPMEMIAYRKKI